MMNSINRFFQCELDTTALKLSKNDILKMYEIFKAK